MKRQATLSDGVRKGKSVLWQRGWGGRGELENVEVIPHEFRQPPEKVSSAEKGPVDQILDDQEMEDNFMGITYESIGSSYKNFKHDFTQYQRKQETLLSAWQDIRISLRDALVILESEQPFSHTCPSGKCAANKLYQNAVDCICFEGIYDV